MNFFTWFIYLVIMNLMALYLDKKYRIISRFEKKENKGFRRAINSICIVAGILIAILISFEDKLNSVGVNIVYIEVILGFPLYIRYYIHITIWELIRKRLEESKNKSIDLNFCYYCGSELDGSDICPSCGRVLDI